MKTPAESRSASLKRVLENCNCSTQTNCTCDFVDKLIERFNKASAISSMLLKENASQQIRDAIKCQCEHVGIQTQLDTKHELAVDSKVSQTEGSTFQNIAIQTAEVPLPTQTEESVILSANMPITKTLGRDKVDVACACEINHATQTKECKRVVLTCSSHSDESRTISTKQIEGRSNSAGISRLKKYKKAGSSVNRYCECGGRHARIEELTSSKSSTLMTSSNNGTMESTSDPSSKTVICVCCQDKYPPDKISVLCSADQNFPLCTSCYQKRPILTSFCYAGPHVCTCYKLVRNDLLHDIKTTANDLYNLEFCTCATPSLTKNSQYCAHCQMRLRNTSRTRSGIAYTLTLEEASPKKIKIKKKKRKPSLEEIRIKVPCPYAKKEHKERVNFYMQDGDKKGTTESYMERVTTDSSNKKAPKTKVICSKTKRSKRSNLTLQDYLRKNKPDFIDTAENRRQTLFNSRSERELIKDEAKLRFYEDSRCHCDKIKKGNTKLFTEQEIKAITKRNYAKLPEVQQKNNEQRERRLRNADKFIVDVFSTKIRHSALRGKKDFPLSQNIVSLPKA